MQFEHFRTCIAYTMAVLNDRPISFVYTKNSEEGLSLTPSMLTTGHDVLEPPHISFEAKNDKIGKALGQQFADQLKFKNDLWNTWREEYVTGLFEWHSRTRGTGRLRVPKLDDICLIYEGNNKIIVPRREWKLGRVIGFKEPRRDSHLRQVRVKTLTKTGRPSYLNRSPADLFPLEVEAHQIEDPIINSYVPYIGRPADLEAGIQSTKLPPFWTQPTTIPDSLKYGKKNKSNAPPRSRASSKAKRTALIPEALDEDLGITELFDPGWQPKIRQSVPVSTRVLRPRAPGLGIVIPGPAATLLQHYAK